MHLHLESSTAWSICDLGAFGQTLMLVATARKIDSIPAWKSVKYPSVVKNIMQIPDDKPTHNGDRTRLSQPSDKDQRFYTERSEVDKVLLRSIQRGPTTMPMVGASLIISCSLV